MERQIWKQCFIIPLILANGLCSSSEESKTETEIDASYFNLWNCRNCDRLKIMSQNSSSELPGASCSQSSPTN